MNNILNGKNILFIGPSFFNYEVEIKNGLESLGAKVDYFDERPENNFVTKVLLRVKLGCFIKNKIDNYYNNIFRLIKENTYNYVLIINPETINCKKIEAMRAIQCSAKFILYMWDSIKNKKNSSNIITLFDKYISFDKRDSQLYGMDFLPLFYIGMYENIKQKNTYKYDICFIGTAHSDRYKIVKKIESAAKKLNFKMYSFFYLPSRIMYWVRKLFLLRYEYGNIKNFAFTPLSQSEIVNIIDNSRVILDINHPNQNGLTSRTLESLGANKKLITTNGNVKQYDFYNNQNIQVLDRNITYLDNEFFCTDYKKPELSIYKYYSLNSWLINIFTGSDK
jgi:hypothetical protein